MRSAAYERDAGHAETRPTATSATESRVGDVAADEQRDRSQREERHREPTSEPRQLVERAQAHPIPKPPDTARHKITAGT